jgi:hypothetical protein
MTVKGACQITKAGTHTHTHTHTHSHTNYLILFAFPLQQWLREPATVMRYTYFVYRVSSAAGNMQS